MAKQFQTWVSRADVEALMGVELAEDRQHAGMAVIGAGGPGIKVRYVDLPLDVFCGKGGSLFGLAFDGHMWPLEELTRLTEEMARENWEDPDLVADPYFTVDGKLAGFHIRKLGGGK